MGQDKASHRINSLSRRRVLKQISGVSLGTLAISGSAVGKDAGSSFRSRTAVLKRPVSDPITSDEIEEIQLQILHRAVKHDVITQNVARTIPSPGESLSIVAYYFHIRPDGTPQSWTGTVPTSGPFADTAEATAQKRYHELDRRVKSLKQQEDQQTSETTDFTTQATPHGYLQIDRASSTVGTCAGKLTQTSIAYGHESHARRFVFLDKLHIIPGNNIDGCDNLTDWGIDTAHLNQSWRGNSTIVQERPTGSINGSVSRSINIGYGAAYVSFTYTQPDVSMGTTSDTNDAEWYWAWNSGFYSTSSLTAASRGHFNYEPYIDQVLEKTSAKATFHDGLFDYATYENAHNMIYFENLN